MNTEMLHVVLLSMLFFTAPAQDAIESARGTQTGTVQMELATFNESYLEGEIKSYVNTFFSVVLLYGIMDKPELRKVLDFREEVILENGMEARNKLSGYFLMLGPAYGLFPGKSILPQPMKGDVFLSFGAGRYFWMFRSAEAVGAVFAHTFNKKTYLLYSTGVVPGVPQEQDFYGYALDCKTRSTRNSGYCFEPFGDLHPEGPGNCFSDPGFFYQVYPHIELDAV